MGIDIPDAMSSLTNIFVPGYGGFRMMEKIADTRKGK
jgi:hypothetical protein